MDKFDRIYTVHHLLEGRRVPVPMSQLMERLGVRSPSSVHRTFEDMRKYLHAPIERDAELGGYRYGQTPDGGPFQLPGLWFSPHELQALVVLQNLLEGLRPGLLEAHLQPLTGRLHELLKHKRLRLSEAGIRIRLCGQATRSPGQHFDVVAGATLQRRKLKIRYHSRGKDEQTERVGSPQRLVHYRDNWYLDVWDELRGALRSFSVDRIRAAAQLEIPADERPAAELNEHFASAYGIFSGKANKTAVLRFSGERARWIADERWHPEQSGQFLTGGRYELRIPYRESRELVMDVLRHGAEAEVVGPEALREEVRRALVAALEQYGR